MLHAYVNFAIFQNLRPLNSKIHFSSNNVVYIKYVSKGVMKWNDTECKVWDGKMAKQKKCTCRKS